MAIITLDPNNKSSWVTLSNGNMTGTGGVNSYWRGACTTADATFSPGAGNKYYWEVKIDAAVGETYGDIGVADIANSVDGYVGNTAGEVGLLNTGTLYEAGVPTNSWSDPYTTDDIIGVAMDLENLLLFYAINGVWQASGNPVTGANGRVLANQNYNPWLVWNWTGAVMTINFGVEGFVYEPPTGYGSPDYTPPAVNQIISGNLSFKGVKLG